MSAEDIIILVIANIVGNSSNRFVDLGDIKVNDSTYSHSYTNNAGSGKSINADVNMGDIKINR